MATNPMATEAMATNPMATEAMATNHMATNPMATEATDTNPQAMAMVTRTMASEIISLMFFFNLICYIQFQGTTNFKIAKWI